jgi:hypothetical protein
MCLIKRTMVKSIKSIDDATRLSNRLNPPIQVELFSLDASVCRSIAAIGSGRLLASAPFPLA